MQELKQEVGRPCNRGQTITLIVAAASTAWLIASGLMAHDVVSSRTGYRQAEKPAEIIQLQAPSGDCISGLGIPTSPLALAPCGHPKTPCYLVGQWTGDGWNVDDQGYFTPCQ